MDTSVDLYNLLQVSKNATESEIKKAYKQMARSFHPDKVQDKDTTEMMKLFNIAKEVLLDPEKRKEYDEKFEASDENSSFVGEAEGFLSGGNRLSKIFEEQIAQSKKEWKTGKVQKMSSTRFETELFKSLDELTNSSEYSNIFSNTKIPCPRCNQSFSEERLLRDHLTQLHTAYHEILRALTSAITGDVIDHILKNKEVTKWNLQRPKEFLKLSENIPASSFIQFCNAVPLVPQHVEKSSELMKTLDLEWLELLKNPPQAKGLAMDSSNQSKIPNLISKEPIRAEIELILFPQNTTNSNKNSTPIIGSSIAIFPFEKLSSSASKEMLKCIKTKDNIPQFTVKSAPQWVPDSSYSQCQKCQAKFNIFNRRHHCRACGRLLCKICINCVVILPQFGMNEGSPACYDCKEANRKLHVEKWLESGQNHIQQGRVEIGMQFLCFIRSVFPDLVSSEKWKILGNSFLRSGNFIVAFQCYSYANISRVEWIDIAVAHSNNFAVSSECIAWAKKAPSSTSDSSTILKAAHTLQDPNLIKLLYSIINLNDTQWMEEGDFWFNKKSYHMSWQCHSNITKSVLQERAISTKDNLIKFQYARISALPLEKWIALVSKEEILPLWSYCFELQFSSNKESWIQLSSKALANKKYELVPMCLLKGNAPVISYLIAAVTMFNSNRYAEARGCLASVKDTSTEEWKKLGLQMKSSGKITEFIICLLQAGFTSGLNNSEVWEKIADSLTQEGNIECACVFYSVGTKNWSSFDYFMNLSKSAKTIELRIQYLLIAYQLRTEDKIILELAQQLQSNKLVVLAMELLAFGINKWKKSKPSQSTCYQYHMLMAKCLSDMKSSHSIILEAYEWAEEELVGQSLPQQLVQEMTHLKKEMTENDKKKENEMLKPLIQAYASRNYQSLIIQITNAYHEDKIELMELFVLYQFIQTKGYLNEMPETDQAVYQFATGVYNIMKGEVFEGIRDLTKAMLNFPSTEYIIAPVATILGDPALRFRLLIALLNSSKNKRLQTLGREWLPEIEIPEKHKYQQYLRKTGGIAALTRCEKGVVKEFSSDPLKCALWYCDLIEAAVDSSSGVACCILAGIYFTKAMEGESTENAYAYKNAVFECIKIANSWAARSHPPLRIHTASITAALALKAVTIMKGVGCLDIEAELVASFFQTVVKYSVLYPAIICNVEFASDAIFQNIIDMQLLPILFSNYRQMKYESSSNSSIQLLQKYEVAYYRFEGKWQGWLQDEDDNNNKVLDLQQTRSLCMDELLSFKKFSWKQVAELVDWLRVPRTPDGFISPSQLPTFGEFRAFNGFTINVETGEIKFLASPSKYKQPGLFSGKDIAEILEKGITSSFFSLDEADSALHIHPFQQMRYAPATLQGTGYLGTMFHTDYLLKFFSTGVEVSAKPPFLTCPIQEGLLKRLPSYLVNALKPILERESSKVGQAHRFWIEAGEIPYHQEIRNNEISYYFGEVPMKVKKHLLMRNAQGELVDAPNDPFDDSPEGEFARNFTKYYDDLGKYFPEFLRLKELIKIAAMYILIKGHKDSFDDTFGYSNINTLRSKISSDLKSKFQKIRSDIGEKWPRAEDSSFIDSTLQSEIANVKSKITSQYGYAAWTWQVESEAKSTLRPQIVSALRKADEESLRTLVTQIASQFSVSEYSIRSNVEYWLRNWDSSGLVSVLAEVQIQETKKPYDRITKTLSNIRFCSKNLESQASFSPMANYACGWVPSAFRREENGYTIMVYGGVSMNIQLQKQVLQPPPTSSYTLSPTTLGAQRANNIPNSPAQLMDNLKAFNDRVFWSSLQSPWARNYVMNSDKVPGAIRGWNNETRNDLTKFNSNYTQNQQAQNMRQSNNSNNGNNGNNNSYGSGNGRGGGRAPELPSGQLKESQVLNCALKWLGTGYSTHKDGRYVSSDGMRQFRYGNHETKQYPSNHHCHFEAYDTKGGRVIENALVEIVKD